MVSPSEVNLVAKSTRFSVKQLTLTVKQPMSFVHDDSCLLLALLYTERVDFTTKLTLPADAERAGVSRRDLVGVKDADHDGVVAVRQAFSILR